MGRSSGSCFKIIACGSDSAADTDDTQPPPAEFKGSSDKTRWSFRKRSARHRVLSNSVELPSSLNKENQEVATINLQIQRKETFPEKNSGVLSTDERPLSNAAIVKEADTTVAPEDGKLNCVYPDESVIIVIQAAIRRYLARRQMLKVKNAVKLQAAVRGHLVRRHAVGTLRCVQGIIRMQGLVRARQARFLLEGKIEGNLMQVEHGSLPLDKENSVTKLQDGHTTSMEKLLSNKFAHQLLESTPRSQPIYIKCDPSSKSDSAWNWLERWMSVSSKGNDSKVQLEGCESNDIKLMKFPSESFEESSDSKASDVPTVAAPFKFDQSTPTYDSKNSSKNDILDPVMPMTSDTSIIKESSSELLPDESKQSDSNSEREHKPVSSKPAMDVEQPTKSLKRSASGEGESEGKRYAFGTRKSTNPAFAAVQSKFEGLSTSPSLARSTSSKKQIGGVELKSNATSVDNEIPRREVDMGDTSASHTLAVKNGGSECGTELSITSTLDSPDGSDTGVVEVDQEIELKLEGSGDSNLAKELDDKTNGESVPDLDVSNSISVPLEKLDEVDDATEQSAISMTTIASSQEKQNMETNASEEKVDVDNGAGHQASKSSSDTSPRSQMTVPEFQGTPSSQVSVKANRAKNERGSSNQKKRSSSAGKASPSSTTKNSESKSSLDPFPKDLKSGKRRNSFGSGRSDFTDQEPRESSSSNSLPSYMQATESARAKLLLNSSPRSSPDLQEKDIYIKKRYSLPGTSGKQGSPRLQHSKSQAPQGAKANGHPQERKWQR